MNPAGAPPGPHHAGAASADSGSGAGPWRRSQLGCVSRAHAWILRGPSRQQTTVRGLLLGLTSSLWLLVALKVSLCLPLSSTVPSSL